jgi:hypothetical protein
LLLEVLDLDRVQVYALLVLDLAIVFRRILATEVSEELEVDESQECSVELEEGAHDLIINIKWELLVKLVGRDPSDLLSHNFNLIVDSLDRQERLLEALSNCAVEHELLQEVVALLNLLLGDLERHMLGHVCEQADQT